MATCAREAPPHIFVPLGARIAVAAALHPSAHMSNRVTFADEANSKKKGETRRIEAREGMRKVLAAERKVQTAVEAPVKQLGHRAQPLLERWEHFNRSARNWSLETSDKVTNSVLDNMLRSLGSSLREIAQATFRGTPQWWLERVDRFVVSLWQSLQPVVREYMTGPVPGDYSKLLVLNWSTEYPYFWPTGQWPQPYGWLRGRRCAVRSGELRTAPMHCTHAANTMPTRRPHAAVTPLTRMSTAAGSSLPVRRQPR